MKRIIIAALAATAVAGSSYAATKCVVCKGTGWNGQHKCASCGGDGVFGN